MPSWGADLYAIIKTIEKLERAYVRDAVTAKDYEPASQKLLSQYRTLWDTVRDDVREGELGGADRCGLGRLGPLAGQAWVVQRATLKRTHMSGSYFVLPAVPVAAAVALSPRVFLWSRTPLPAVLALSPPPGTLTPPSPQVPDVEQFMLTYNMQCPMAVRRMKSGMPATLEHGGAQPDATKSSAYAVAETVQHFITTMDCLKINMVAVDQVYPLLSDLLQGLNRVGTGCEGVAADGSWAGRWVLSGVGAGPPWAPGCSGVGRTAQQRTCLTARAASLRARR